MTAQLLVVGDFNGDSRPDFRESSFSFLSRTSGEGGKPGVAKFATSLFGEPFEEQAIIFGQTEAVPELGSSSLTTADYALLESTLAGDAAKARDAILTFG